jgi:hypothetical protein
VRDTKYFASRFAAVSVMAMLVATSVFADSRPSNETRGRSDRRDVSRRDRGTDSRRGDNSSNGSYRRGDENRQPYHARGRVSRVAPYGSGYRVWVGGAPYPFFIPSAYYNRNRFRVGVTLNIGGYYNPRGYYDYYDGYRDGRGYSDGVLRGTVESVDYRRDTFVIRNDATGSFVTVVVRDRRDNVRPGDYVEISGDWTRSGVFQAYDVDRLDDGYRR